MQLRNSPALSSHFPKTVSKSLKNQNKLFVLHPFPEWSTPAKKWDFFKAHALGFYQAYQYIFTNICLLWNELLFPVINKELKWKTIYSTSFWEIMIGLWERLNSLILIEGLNNVSHKIIDQGEINLAIELIVLLPLWRWKEQSVLF